MKTVKIETTLGDVYTFPAMEENSTKVLIRSIVDKWVETGSLTLVNVSQSVLIVPSRIIAKVSLDDEVLWCSNV